MGFSPAFSDFEVSVEGDSEVEFLPCVSYRLDTKLSDLLGVSLSAVKLSFVMNITYLFGVQASLSDTFSNKNAGLFHDNRASRLKFIVDTSVLWLAVNVPSINSLNPETLCLHQLDQLL